MTTHPIQAPLTVGDVILVVSFSVVMRLLFQMAKFMHRVTCHTVGVYLAKCLCGCFYVGKTKHPFFKHKKDHTTSISKRLMTTATSRHVGFQHHLNINMIKFMALKHVSTHARGGSIDCTLLKLETQWIHTLYATIYPGLNEYISFKSFL